MGVEGMGEFPHYAERCPPLGRPGGKFQAEIWREKWAQSTQRNRLLILGRATENRLSGTFSDWKMKNIDCIIETEYKVHYTYDTKYSKYSINPIIVIHRFSGKTLKSILNWLIVICFESNRIPFGSENGKYNLISVAFTRTRSLFLYVSSRNFQQAKSSTDIIQLVTAIIGNWHAFRGVLARIAVTLLVKTPLEVSKFKRFKTFYVWS